MFRLIGFAAIICATFSAAGLEVKTLVEGGRTNRYFEEMVPMRDGTKLYTFGPFPEPGRKVSIEVVRNCYVPNDKRPDMRRTARAYRNDRITITQHCRGCGMSEGDCIPYVNEHNDGLDLLAWIRTLPFYDGRIYLTGGSYLSSVHLCYLAENPPDVKGCKLDVQDCRRYNILFRNGIYKKGLNGNWYAKMYKKKSVLPNADTNVTFDILPLKDYAIRRFGEHAPALEAAMAAPNPNDAFWTTVTGGIQAADAFTRSTMPILFTTGWYDLYTEGVFDMWRSMPPERRANCALVCGAYDHAGSYIPGRTPYRFTPDASRTARSSSVSEWADYCEKGIAPTNARPGYVTYYALWENRWYVERDLTDGSETRVFRPSSEGGLHEGAPSAGDATFVYDPEDCPVFPGGGPIAFDGMQVQPEPGFRPDVKSFVSAPFEETIDVRGRMRVNLEVSSDCDDTCFYVRTMIRKHRTGKWYNLRDDITGLLFAAPAFNPGARVPISFTLSDHAFRIEPGDRIRLDVAGGNGRYFVRHTNFAGSYLEQTRTRKARNTIFLDACSWTIPVKPQAPDAKRAFWKKAFTPPAKYAFSHRVKPGETYDLGYCRLETYTQACGPAGDEQRVFLAVPKNLKGKAPAVVIPFYFPEAMLGEDPVTRSTAHANCHKGTNLTYYANVRYMRDLVERGYIAISADAYHLTYRSARTGESCTGWPAVGAAITADWPEWTGIGKLVADTRLLVDMLAADSRVDGERIGAIGHSLGGKMAFCAGALDPRIKVIVASDFGIGWEQTNWRDTWYWGKEKVAEAIRLGTDNADLLTYFAPGKPVMIVAGKYDNAQSRDILMRAGGYDDPMGAGDRVVLDHATGHRPPFWANVAAYAFLDCVLKP